MDTKKEKKQGGWVVIILIILAISIIPRDFPTHKAVLQTALAAVAFPFIWVFEKIIEIGFWNIICWGIYLCFFAWVINKITHAYELLNGLSDDINDIKKKLGLPTVIRTPLQRDEQFKEWLREAIYQERDLKKLFRKKELKMYNSYIAFITNRRQEAKYCPDCMKFYDWGSTWKCDTCKGDLVLVKDTWKNEVFTSPH